MFDPSLWKDFDFKEAYPGRDELCDYFDHLDTKLKFSEHTEYSRTVTGAKWNDETRKWTVELEGGEKAIARWFVPAIGFAAKPYIPKMKGMEKFKGEMHHSAVRFAISL
jgi:cation diffusion facilitator CzcD-associated flavoprotein CzcO